jgi:Secretion system C-terminal sorting domain/Cleaved Adhesin Domain
MKKITVLLMMLVSFFSQAQSTIFEDSFESYTNFAIANVGNWTLTDLDGAIAYPSGTFTFPNYNVPKSFQVFNPTSGVSAALGATWEARTGVQSMACFSAIPDPGPPIISQNNDWLISPQMTLGTANTVSFWTKASNLTDFAEKFSVYVSSTTTAVSSFVKISPATVALPYVTLPSPGGVWRQYTYAIPTTYNSAPVYLAIQCVSDDKFGFLVDDFKVTGTVPCAAPTQLSAVVNISALTATLTWTAGGAVDTEVKVQLAGAGTPATANNTGVTALGNYTTTPLLANTNYEYWVRAECTNGVLFSSWSGPFLFNTNTFPNCANLTLPANLATGVPFGVPINLTWAAATTGPLATSYDVFFGTTAVPTVLVGTPTVLTFSQGSLQPSTTYYWKVVSKNASGSAVNCSSVFSFTTALAVPANDNFANAIAISCASNYTGNTSTATLDEDSAPDGFGTDMDSPNVWYKYTGTGTAQTVTLNLCGSSYDSSVLVYTGTSGSLTLIAANDDDATCTTAASLPQQKSRVSFNSDGLTTYYIAVEGYNVASTGAFTMDVICANVNPPAVANQNCVTSLLVPVNGVAITSDNSYGDVNPNQPTCDFFGNVQDVWFSFEAPFSSEVTCTIANTTMTSANFTIYSGTCGTLSEIVGTCNNNLTVSTSENLTGLVPGSTYFVQVWSNAAEQGTFTLKLTDTSLLATDTFSSANFKFYPNPAKEVLNMSYDKNITSVSIMNLLGQVVLTNSVDNKEAKIDMSSLTTGTYMVKVFADNEVKTIKVIKE